MRPASAGGTAEAGFEVIRDVAARVDEALRDLVDREMAQLTFLGDEAASVHDLLGRFVLAPGKRLRPAFVYWGHRAARRGAYGPIINPTVNPAADPADVPAADPAVALGCAVELVHTCALICDDVMDDATARRGRPALHVEIARRREADLPGRPTEAAAYGANAAIVLGLLALTWADAAFDAAGLAPGVAARAGRHFLRLRTEVIGGQYLDITHAGRVGAGPADVDQIVRYKSATYTVQRPLLLGYAAGGGVPAGEPALARYGLALGEAYQLRDDVLGVFGDPLVTGKPVGADLRQRKQTRLFVLARGRAGPAGRGLLDTLHRDAPREHVTAARDLIVSTGALADTEARIGTLAGRAAESVAGAAHVADDARHALLSLAAGLTGRER